MDGISAWMNGTAWPLSSPIAPMVQIPIESNKSTNEKRASFTPILKAKLPRCFRESSVSLPERCSDIAWPFASGGRREQILRALRGTSVEHAFGVLVSAEDIAVGKPDPAIYRYTLERLNARRQAEPPVRPQECVVVEDSIAGIAAGLAADMKVVGVSTTYPAEHLTQAHLVLPSLEEVPLDRLEALFTERD